MCELWSILKYNKSEKNEWQNISKFIVRIRAVHKKTMLIENCV